MKNFSFQTWLEDKQDNYNFYKDLILGKLNYNKKNKINSVSTSLKLWNPPDNLISLLDNLGEFKNLDDKIQKQVKDKILSQEGTLGDIIDLMSKDRKK
jgi:hypothetical protein